MSEVNLYLDGEKVPCRKLEIDEVQSSDPQTVNVVLTDVDATPNEELRELVDELNRQAQNVEDRSDSNLPEEYENGICAGIRYARDELKELID